VASNITPSESSTPASGIPRGGGPDTLTIIAIAIVATVVADVLHEAPGMEAHAC